MRSGATKKLVKIWQNCWTNNLKFDMNINLAVILLLYSLLLLFFQYLCLFSVLGYLKVAISDVGIPKSYIIAITVIVRARNFKTVEQSK